jgi:type I restriction enzyme S subunit
MLNSSKQTGSALKPYLRNINLQWGRIDLSDVKEMDIFDNEMRQFMLAKGDVLVCEGGEPGRSAVWNLDIEMGFQNAIHRIRPRERLSSEFACYQFEWLVKNGILDELFTGVTIKHFSQQKLRKVEFVVPSLNEQEKIVQILEEQFSRLDASLVIADAIETKASNMRRSLLHAAFTGELTRGWREGAHV